MVSCRDYFAMFFRYYVDDSNMVRIKLFGKVRNMEFRVIKNPSPGTVAILTHRLNPAKKEKPENYDTIGLVQGKMIEMVVAADIAEKAVGVTVEDIHGSCPQNMIMLAIYGETSAVESAMEKIKTEVNDHPYLY